MRSRTSSRRSACSLVSRGSRGTVGLDPSLPSPRVPVEIVECIIVAAVNTDDAICYITSFVLVCSFFRDVALRNFMNKIVLQDRAHWDSIFAFVDADAKRSDNKELDRDAFSGIRSLWASSDVLQKNIARLSVLSGLEELSINCDSEGLATQHLCIKSMVYSLLNNTQNCSQTLTTLTLTSLARIDLPLLRMISNNFPMLVDLYLSSTERLDLGHCWACFEESLSCIDHSPVGDTYHSYEDLAIKFAHALKPLNYLKHLHLGIFLSDERLLYTHFEHVLQVDEADLGMAFGPDECSICESMSKTIRMNELSASLLVAQRIKTLETIGWSSFFSFGGDDLDSIGEGPPSKGAFAPPTGRSIAFCWLRRTKIWIIRTGGRVRVRRIPW